MTFERAALTPDAGAPRRRGGRLKTAAEQIAEHLGAAIVDGEYRAGERLREVEIANTYGASRAPVREAIRALSQRGLVIFEPRRGAYVVELSLDTIADTFNMRAVLMGLAARLIARRPPDGTTDAMRERIADCSDAVPHDDPIGFAHLVGRVGAVTASRCGSEPLTATLKEQTRHSVWGLLWRKKALDFTTPERRLAVVRELVAIADAIDAGEDVRAERCQRLVHFNARDNAIAMLRLSRAETGSSDRALKDDV